MWKNLLFFGFLAITAARQTGSGVDAQPRIVGGEPAEITQFPHQLSLEIRGLHTCGAAILRSVFAVTAAHCVKDLAGSDITLRAGSSIKGSGGTLHSAGKIIVHPFYDKNLEDFDVAVIKVIEPFQYSNTTKPIFIGDVTPSEGELVTVSGWGTTSENGDTTSELHAATIPVVDISMCTFNYLAQGRQITDRMFCAGSVGHDSCEGDSGGPLILNDLLVGVVSWSVGCARPNYPGVYTRLGHPNIYAWLYSVTTT